MSTQAIMQSRFAPSTNNPLMPANASDYGLFFHEDKLLLHRQSNAFILPLHAFSACEFLENTHNRLYLGAFQQKKIHAVHLPQEHQIDLNDFILTPARDILVTTTDVSLGQLLCRAKQLITWHQTSLFCGHCGAPTQLSARELCKICNACSRLMYPVTSPAILVLIQRDHEILLARSPHFEPGMYSALAGFVDAGESCEQTVEREILEEVGVSVKNIRYFGSQAWPFPNSFMLGFKADHAHGEIAINPQEIEDAQWFSKHNLPLLPRPYSIARQMIDLFLQ